MYKITEKAVLKPQEKEMFESKPKKVKKVKKKVRKYVRS